MGLLERLKPLQYVNCDTRCTLSVSGGAIQVNTMLATIATLVRCSSEVLGNKFSITEHLHPLARTDQDQNHISAKISNACCRALADTSFSTSFRSLKQVSTTSGKKCQVVKLYDTIKASSSAKKTYSQRAARQVILLHAKNNFFPISEANIKLWLREHWNVCRSNILVIFIFVMLLASWILKEACLQQVLCSNKVPILLGRVERDCKFQEELSLM